MHAKPFLITADRLIRCVGFVLLIAVLSPLPPLSSVATGQTRPADQLKLPAGFQGQRIYEVGGDQGSWVSLTNDPQGRLITSDQYGKLYRVTLADDAEPKVEPIELKIGFAQGLLCAFDSLYVVAHGNRSKKRPPGFYRIKDTDGDDQYDSVELLRKFDGGSEHGPHAVILSPDKQSLYICAGNHTKLPEIESSRLPKLWQEDQVLTRFPDPGGHAAGRMAPGGWICKTDPDGKSFELIAAGFRNQYDIAFDPNGELFTFDADMEWDFGLPWYRPTRVCHVVSGAEFGWRNGSGKWPAYYPDSVPAVVNVGPGSPTGIAFATQSKFPTSFRDRLFIADWSYGKIYSVAMTANGATFSGELEDFCSAPALPVTDLIFNPVDGAMYFLIGGRRSQSALYRISYVGDQSTEPKPYPAPVDESTIRKRLELMHVDNQTFDLEFVWKQLNSDDRALRYAARVALEHQPPAQWFSAIQSRLDKEPNVNQTIESMIAIARVSSAGEAEKKSEIGASILDRLSKLDWKGLSVDQRLSLLRTYDLVKCRLEATDAAGHVSALSEFLPSGDNSVDRELAKTLVAFAAPNTTEKIVGLLLSPSSQKSQIDYAKTLSDAKSGWTTELREKYFEWFLDIAKARGGNSLGGYIGRIRKHAIEGLTETEKEELADVLAKEIVVIDPYADLKARPIVKEWKLSDLLPIDDSVFENRDLENGKKMFAVATCYNCHRIHGAGGNVGPVLTAAGHRFSTHDLLETIIDPNKEISDQYEATMFQMQDGSMIIGRVANLAGDQYWIQEDMIDPLKFTKIKVDEIEDSKPSTVSMMPAGLLDHLSKDEILDLMAYMKQTINGQSIEE